MGAEGVEGARVKVGLLLAAGRILGLGLGAGAGAEAGAAALADNSGTPFL